MGTDAGMTCCRAMSPGTVDSSSDTHGASAAVLDHTPATDHCAEEETQAAVNAQDDGKMTSASDCIHTHGNVSTIMAASMMAADACYAQDTGVYISGQTDGGGVDVTACYPWQSIETTPVSAVWEMACNGRHDHACSRDMGMSQTFSEAALAEYDAMCMEHADEAPLTSRLQDIVTPIDPNVGVAGNGGKPSDDVRLWRLIESCPSTLFDMMRIADARDNQRILYLLQTMVAVAAENMSFADFRRVFGAALDGSDSVDTMGDEDTLYLKRAFGQM